MGVPSPSETSPGDLIRRVASPFVGPPQRRRGRGGGGAGAPVPAPEAEVRARRGPVQCEPGRSASRSARRSFRASPLPVSSFTGRAMLSLDFLDDVRRMNKRQVRLAAPCLPGPPGTL